MKCFNQYDIDKLTVKDEIQFEIIDSLSMFFCIGKRSQDRK